MEMNSNVLTSFQGLDLTATVHNKVSTWSHNNEENELQLSQHNCIQATPAKVGNNESLAQSNKGSGDENFGTAHWSSLKTHNERKNHNKNIAMDS